MTAKKRTPLNEIARIVALAKAAPYVRECREKGHSWDVLQHLSLCNPLKLSHRQLARIYDGPGAYEFDSLRRIAKH